MENQKREVRVLKKINAIYRKLKVHWSYYKACKRGKKFVLFNYIVWILFYRRFVCYIIALPLLLIYFILYPFVKFRFLRLIGSAIGHYSSNTELLLAKLSTLKDDEFINIFYLEHTLCEPTSICNLQLHQMWKRTLLMLPLRCFSIVERLDQLIMCFLGNRAYGLNGDKKYLRARAIGTRDRNGYFKATPTTLSFTPEEHQRATEMLGRVNITLNTPYVCLLVRSSAY